MKNYYFVPKSLDLAAFLKSVDQNIRPIHFDKFYYLLDSLYLRRVINRRKADEFLPVSSQILRKIVTTEWGRRVKQILVEGEVLEEQTSYRYRRGERSKSYRFAAAYRSGFVAIPVRDDKLLRRVGEAQSEANESSIGNSEVLRLIRRSIEGLEFDLDGATRLFKSQTFALTEQAQILRKWMLEAFPDPSQHFYTTDRAGRFYHVLTSMPREFRSFLTWHRKPLFIADVGNCQPCLLSTLYTKPSAERKFYERLVSQNKFFSFLNSKLRKPYDLSDPAGKRAFKDEIYHRVFYGSNFAHPTDISKAFKRCFPELAAEVYNRKRFRKEELPVELQTIEANLVIEGVSAEFVANHRDEDLCLISIHDGLVSTREHMNELQRLLKSHFSRYLEFEVPVKISGFTGNDREPVDSLAASSISDKPGAPSSISVR